MKNSRGIKFLAAIPLVKEPGRSDTLNGSSGLNLNYIKDKLLTNLVSYVCSID